MCVYCSIKRITKQIREIKQILIRDRIEREIFFDMEKETVSICYEQRSSMLVRSVVRRY